ncbi:efflux RND transporter permease subunit [Stenotrophomonas sp. 24(2023)]|uniref:efflux RND transporter permease subunit n=1 Tax=Stenotrophomonas sp. 24(2023) TaxID=3068324 RepID=UPI0027DF37F7|nr:efflux RND transporter permease subunit [Stenotrophomonas sp. 24(2023)]WMJ69345.1 efflux RND transporter permease subunit [Stenotrophomonas sp. 24(2023)]
MSLATWSLRHPFAVVLLFVLLVLGGLRSFQQLPVQDYPDIELPTVQVTLAQPGAVPSQLESEVARKVEDALSTLPSLKHLRTSIRDGVVSIRVEFELGKSLSDALIEAKDAVDRTRADLPSDLLPPTVSAVHVSVSPVLTYALSSPAMDEAALSWFIDDALTRRLRRIPGVEAVGRVGGVDREIEVEVDPARLSALGVTVADVSRALRLNQQQSSGGRSELGGGQQAVRVIALAARAEEVAALPVALADGRELRLDEVARVRDGHALRTRAATLDGAAVIGVEIFRARDRDQLALAAGVAAAMQQLVREHPGLRATEVVNRVDYTHEQYRGSMQMLWEGALLAVLVVWWFLRDWRATLVAAAALPLSILPTFIGMQWLGYSLNTLTLLALAVIVGILVDDAIVEVENIQRHRVGGKPIREVTEAAVNEIALAVLATTLTLVVVFLPTALMSGTAGLFFRQFGWTTVIAVLASLLVARLVTPLLAVALLRDAPLQMHGNEEGRWMRAYLRLADAALRRPLRTLLLALGTVVGSLLLATQLPAGLVPAADRGYTSVQLELPPGGSLQATLARAEQARRAIAGLAGVRGVYIAAGAAPAGPDGGARADPGRASLAVLLVPAAERPSQQQIEARIRQALQAVPGARFAVGAGALGERLELILASDSPTALAHAASSVMRGMRGIAGLSNVRTTAGPDRPEMVVRPRAAAAAEQGLTAAALGETIRIASSGDFSAALPRLSLEQRQLDVRVRLPRALLAEDSTLGNLQVRGRAGLLPLANVADIALESGPAQVDRYDRVRQVTLVADLGGVPLGRALAQVRALPAVQALPASVGLLQSGDAEWAGELAASFGWAMLLAVVCVYGVLVLLLGNLAQPLTILTAIPLSACGAVVALVVAGAQLDIPSMLGVVMLMGIVSKNAILLVEHASTAMRAGLGSREALLDACRTRARPILMTSVAMVAGMLPIAVGIGADASFRQPMAVAVIGGLLSSTVLSLLVVPVAYQAMQAAAARLARWRGRA